MPSPSGIVAAVVLAAGKSGRMGENKLLLPWKNKPLLVHSVETALHVSPPHSVDVVVGCDSPRVVEALERHFGTPLPFSTVHNPDWSHGQSTSLRRGLASALSRPDTESIDAVMFVLGDQPLIRADTLDRLIAAHRAAASTGTHPATAPTYQNRRGNPAILSRTLFPRIEELRGDTGARGILDSLGDTLLLVPVDDPGIHRDIDTREAYDRLCRGG